MSARGDFVSDNTEPLLGLIGKAQAIAEREGRSTIAYFLSVAADSAIEEKRLELAKVAQASGFKHRQWKWSLRRWPWPHQDPRT